MIEINIDSEQVHEKLARLEDGLGDLTPVMEAIEHILIDQTEENFAQQGRPPWEPLADATIAKRTKEGSWPGKIMIVSGRLAASYTGQHGSDFASVGSNVIYAAIQNLGGQAGRNHKVTIPARPQLPVDASGQLQPETESEILTTLNEYLSSLAD